MKRHMQMVRAGVPSPREARKATVARVSRNRTMPSTLGAVPIVMRSLECVGGTRPGKQMTKKRNNKARKAGFTGWGEMQDFLAKMALKQRKAA